jgi:superfamily II RNA helicase
LVPNIALDADAPEVRDQQGRVAAVEAQLQAHPLRKWGDPAYLLKRQKRIERMQEELASRQEKLSQYTQHYWQEFLNLMEILQAFGCLENDKPNPLGQVAAAIRGDNELWLGLSLASGELDRLDPHHLAAACAALVTEVSRPDNWTRYDPSAEVEEALGGLRSIRRELFKLQRRYQVALPVWLETEWIGLVEQWALGVEWMELCANTSLDEGDVVRILRRTVDFLSQVPHVPYLAGELKSNAVRAIQLLDRFPVNEGVD